MGSSSYFSGVKRLFFSLVQKQSLIEQALVHVRQGLHKGDSRGSNASFD
jgi:hypothetical protein